MPTDEAMIKLFEATTQGEIQEQQFIDDEGSVTDQVEVLRFKQLSKKHALIEVKNTRIVTSTISYPAPSPSTAPYMTTITNTTEMVSFGLVNLTSGALTNIDTLQLDFDSVIEVQEHLFGFDTKFSKLLRYDTNTGSVTIYYELPSSATFMSGPRFGVSATTIWWSDDGSTTNTSANFRSILVDEQLNVLVDALGTGLPGLTGSNYQSYVIQPNGQLHQASDTSLIAGGGNGTAPNSGVFLAYSNAGRLIRVASNSGFYTHLWPSSPVPNNIDITASAVTFGSSGVTLTQLAQVKPFVGMTFNRDQNYISIRTNYTIDSNARKIPFPGGFMDIDVSDSANITISYAQTSSDLHQLLYSVVLANQANFIPSMMPTASDDSIYFLNGSATAIQKIAIAPGTVNPVTVASRSGISGFYVAGGTLVYTANSQTYAVDLATLIETPLDSSKAVTINDIVSL